MLSNKKLRFIYRLLTVMLIGFLIYWFRLPTVETNTSASSSDTTQQRQSFFSMDNVTLRRYDETGKINLITTAAKAEQNSQDKEISLQNAQLESLSWSEASNQAETLATINSPVAVYLPGSTQIALCIRFEECLESTTALNSNDNTRSKRDPFRPDDAVVILTDLSTDPPTLVKSSVLFYDNETREMTNNHYTEVLRDSGRLSGEGLQAQLDQHRYQLQRNVSTFAQPTALEAN